MEFTLLSLPLSGYLVSTCSCGGKGNEATRRIALAASGISRWRQSSPEFSLAGWPR